MSATKESEGEWATKGGEEEEEVEEVEEMREDCFPVVAERLGLIDSQSGSSATDQPTAARPCPSLPAYQTTENTS